jgi:DnaJ-class molecular chaperone
MEIANSIVCPDCHGTGQHVVMRTVRPYAKIEPPPPCDRCNGTGRVPRPRPVPMLSRMTQVRRTRRP